MLEEKMEELRKALIGFAILVEKMIESSIQGLLKINREMLMEVIEKEEKQRRFLERLGFVQMMFDFYTAPVV